MKKLIVIFVLFILIIPARGETGVFSQTVAIAGNACFWYRNYDTAMTTNGLMSGAEDTLLLDSALRFVTVPIPQNATITSAKLYIKPTYVGANPIVLILKGEAADSAAQLTNYTDARARTRGTANVNPGTWTDGVEKEIDVKTIIEEITTRAGWVSGNNLQFFLDDNGSSGATGYMRVQNLITQATTRLVISSPNIGVFNMILIF